VDPITLIPLENLSCAVILIQEIVCHFIIWYDFKTMLFVERKRNMYPVATFSCNSYVILTVF